MANPDIDTTTAQQLLLEAQEKAKEVSAGKLSDFSVASPVTALLEAVAIIATRTQTVVNGLSTSIENNRIAIFGIERQQGTAATGSIKITLDALYSEPFFLAKGFDLTIDGIPFETVTDLIIPAYTSSGTVSIICLELSDRGNLPISATVFYQPVSKVSTITLISSTNGGINVESDAEWRQRVYTSIRQRDTLISEEDFEVTVIDYLGAGSTAVAIGRLKQDRVTYANGYVSVFALNANGSLLNESQLAELNSYLNQKTAMAYVIVSSLDLFTITLTVYASFISGNAPDTIANEIRTVCFNYLKPGQLKPGEQILNKAIEKRIQDISGIKEGVVSVLINGLAQPQSLPNAWTVGNLTHLTVNLTSTDTNSTQLFTYNFDS
ncbi:MAG: baseplate J/gp47 family protein [Iphinoe sp. HA4291-MV1]|jgi:uncharacterized phage protein gp47/JayE|nr:baseplate J/gp47 family protein [Iphinoe sp. HA4291-MV1]